MLTVLFVSDRQRLAQYTPYFVGALVAAFMAVASPLPGMSVNPARTFGSAFHAGAWHALWIYSVAPLLGMLAAGEVFLRVRHGAPPFCAQNCTANSALVIKRYLPTGGDFVMRDLRRHRLGSRWRTSSLPSPRRYERRTRLNESIHLIGFTTSR
jgi:hypothetical protein